MKKLLLNLLAATICLSAFSLSVFAANSVTASKTTSRVLVDGEAKPFGAYNIGGYNYFKLRDIAFALSGTDMRFNVVWDAEKKAINLLSDKPYESVGGEMAASNAGTMQTAVPTDSKIYLNGDEIDLTAYNINGNNYFKLRDLSDILAFDLYYAAGADTILIETGKLTAEFIYETISSLEKQYPEGTRWGNNSSYAWKGGIYRSGSGCIGFAFMLSDAAFGSRPARTHKDFDNIKVGDILRMENNTHSVVVLSIEDSSVTITEGNFNSSVHWGRKLTLDEIKKKGDYVMTRYPAV